MDTLRSVVRTRDYARFNEAFRAIEHRFRNTTNVVRDYATAGQLDMIVGQIQSEARMNCTLEDDVRAIYGEPCEFTSEQLMYIGAALLGKDYNVV